MSFKHSTYIAILFTLINLLTSCEKDLLQPDTETEIQRLMEENNLPSLTACVIKDDSLVWSQSYGYSDIENQKIATEKTIYHIGSISKLIIVTAIMQLEEQGKIDLDEDINTYLPIVFRHPDFPDIPITTRMLLTHTVGLSWPQSYDGEQGMWNQFEPDQGPPPSEWVPQFLIPSGVSYDPALWKPIKPGDYEYYSNIGICVVAYIVEQISGQNIREYCRQHIFIPLDMHHTSYNYTDLNSDEIAVMYDYLNKPSYYFDNRIYASGGVKSTIEDLSRFAMCYLNKGLLNNHQILKGSTIEKIFEIQNEASGRCLVWKAYLGDWFGHTGGLLLGTATTLEVHPKSRTCMIIFTNAHSGSVLPGGDIFWLIKQKANQFIE